MENSDARPQRILLATDLSGRCDRALDRAALLALEWKASLVVVHAIESDFLTELGAESDIPSWRRDSVRRTAIAEQQIRDDLQGRDVPFEAIIEEGDPAEVIQKVANDLRCDFIVTGTARSETFGRLILGATVDKIVRRASAPVLVVKTRARHSYRKIVVATDFSDSARQALEATVALFPRSAIAVLHGFAPAVASGQSKAWQEEEHRLAADACARFLAEAALPEEGRAKLQVLIESGSVETLVRAYAYDKGLELLVIGSRGRSTVLNLLLGSTAARLLSSAPCDVLVVRQSEPAPTPSR